ncbi:hypothetical protein ABK040_003721 [Willaertia magna]
MSTNNHKMLCSYLNNIKAIYNFIINYEISKISNLCDLLTKKIEVANGFDINPLTLSADGRNKLLNYILSCIPSFQDKIFTSKQRSNFWKNFKAKYNNNDNKSKKKKVKVTKEGIKRKTDETWLLSDKKEDDNH